MADNSAQNGKRGGIPWRLIAWGGIALVLSLPLIFRAPWTLSDYVLAGAVLGGAGVVVELLARMSGSLAYRAGAFLAVAACVLTLWVNGAVGVFGDEGNPANLMFLGVIAIAVVGSVFAGFRAAGMARAMFSAAAAQVVVAGIAVAAGLGSRGSEGLYEAALATCLFGSMWLVAGGLFRKAADDQAPTIAAS
jgi:hypothetical protein